MNYRQGLMMLTEVYIASVCDYFIGTFSSNVGRLIAEIRRIDNLPSISLDSKYRVCP